MDRDIIQKVLAGKIDPDTAAERVNRVDRVSREEIKHLDSALIDLWHSGSINHEESIRLSRFNHCLSLQNDDQSIIAQTAFTLSQMLAGDPNFFEEGVQLVEYALPILENEGRSPELMGMILYQATLTYYNISTLDQSYSRKVVECGTRALKYFSNVKNTPANVQLQLDYAIGSTLNSIPGVTEADLEKSIVHLRKAVASARILKDQELIGSAPNNLGNSLRLLGERRGDRGILKEAIEVFNQALPFRKHEADIRRTQGNIAITEKTIREIESDKLESYRKDLPKKVSDGLAKVQAGEQCFEWLNALTKEDEDREEGIFKKAINDFCDAISLSTEAKEPEVHAGAELGIGIILNRGKTSGEAAMGVCFLKAAARQFEDLGKAKRLAAAHFNIGEAFSTILESEGEPGYMPVAVKYFEKAWHELEQLGEDKMSHQSLVHLAACYRIMGESGDDTAMQKSVELFKLAGVMLDDNL